MNDALSRSQALVASFESLVRDELPDGVELFDAHVHLGVDIDGMRGDFEELLRIQRAYRIGGSFMFCLDEPDRAPGFRAPNDRTLAHARASGGELIDSPGVRDFAPPLPRLRDVAGGFREIAARAADCRFRDCLHVAEPGCAVAAAFASGEIASRRLESYRSLLALAESMAARAPPRLRR